MGEREAEEERKDTCQERDGQRLHLEERELAEDEPAARFPDVELANVGLAVEKKTGSVSDMTRGPDSLRQKRTLVLRRAPRHISRLPLRLVKVGTRMKSSSTRSKTVQRERCSSSSPVKTRPWRDRRSVRISLRAREG